MDIQSEINTSPIGMHYHVCESCAEVFTAETTDTPYPDGTVEYVGYDTNTPLWCGCDGSVGGREDKMCKDCTELLSDNYYEDRDDDINFADPGGTSSLRAAYGVHNGKCESCGGVADNADNFCRNCGKEFNQRNISCSCGRPNMLTAEDKALGYCCDMCARRNEMDCD